MNQVAIPAAVKDTYPHHLNGKVQYLGGAGGYSGARFWKVHTLAGEFCLRRWPKEHPTPERLAFQHAVLKHAGRHLQFVPLPVPTVHRETWISVGGHLWEVTPWMPGRADFFPQQQAEKLTAAMTALAEFHRAVADFSPTSLPMASPAATQRIAMIDQAAENLPALEIALKRNGHSDEFRQVSQQILTGFRTIHSKIRSDLAQAANIETPLQPVIRDVHSEHILFDGLNVTGIIDFGAMNTDTITVDIARLMGSMAQDDAQAQQIALDAYQCVLSLDPWQIKLVHTLDRATVVLSGVNWLRWIILEGRKFEDFSRVLARLSVTRERLRHLIQTGG